MTSHADTIRAAIENDYTTFGARLGHEALDALVAESQQLRDALERIALETTTAVGGVRDYIAVPTLGAKIARAALDGTPSAAQTLEDESPTERAEASS